MKKLISKVLGVSFGLLLVQSVSASVVTYDYTVEAAGAEGGHLSYATIGDSGIEAVTVTATATNFAGDNIPDYYAYLDDVDVDGRPAGLGVCSTGLLVDGHCVDSSDDNLNGATIGGELLTLTWDREVTITELTFRNKTHHAIFAPAQDFEIRVDGGAWMDFSLVSIFATSLTGTKFDFIVDDTFGKDGCASIVCADHSDSNLYISTITVSTPEPGMIALFLLGAGLIMFSARKRKHS